MNVIISSTLCKDKDRFFSTPLMMLLFHEKCCLFARTLHQIEHFVQIWVIPRNQLFALNLKQRCYFFMKSVAFLQQLCRRLSILYKIVSIQKSQLFENIMPQIEYFVQIWVIPKNYNHFEISGTWRKLLLQKSEYQFFR